MVKVGQRGQEVLLLTFPTEVQNFMLPSSPSSPISPSSFYSSSSLPSPPPPFKKDFIYLFLERRGRREKEMKRNINVWLPFAYSPLGTWPATQTCALTGNWTGDPLVPGRHSVHGTTPARAPPSSFSLLLFFILSNRSYHWSLIFYVNSFKYDITI